MTIDDIEAAAKRMYAVIPQMGLTWKYTKDAAPDLVHETTYLPLPWEHVAERYRNHCRRIGDAALNVEGTER